MNNDDKKAIEETIKRVFASYGWIMVLKALSAQGNKFYFVPKADLAQAIESIELNDTSTALSILNGVVEKAGRDE
jgi:hypothetical protein